MGPHDIGIAASYCFVLHLFFEPNSKFVFFGIFIIECFLHPPDETQLGRNRSQVIDICNRLLYDNE